MKLFSTKPFWWKEVTDRHKVWWMARLVDSIASNNCFFVELLILHLAVGRQSFNVYSWGMAWLMVMRSGSGEIQWSDSVISLPQVGMARKADAISHTGLSLGQRWRRSTVLYGFAPLWSSEPPGNICQQFGVAAGGIFITGKATGPCSPLAHKMSNKLYAYTALR